MLPDGMIFAPGRPIRRNAFRNFLRRKGYNIKKTSHSYTNRRTNQGYYSPQLVQLFDWWANGKVGPRPDMSFLGSSELPKVPEQMPEQMPEHVPEPKKRTTTEFEHQAEFLQLPDGTTYTKFTKRFKRTTEEDFPSIDPTIKQILDCSEAELNSTNQQKFVYAIRCLATNWVKIGFSCDVVRRLCELQTGCPHDLKVEFVHITPRFREMERAMHDYFIEFRIRGEWFELDEDTDFTSVVAELEQKQVMLLS